MAARKPRKLRLSGGWLACEYDPLSGGPPRFITGHVDWLEPDDAKRLRSWLDKAILWMSEVPR